MSSSTNASGLCPEESRNLQARQPKPDEEGVVKAIRALYSCKPAESTYSIYASNAIFHDPIGIAKGLPSIRAQFNGLAKLFHHADIPKLEVLKNPDSGNTILINQDVAYFLKADAKEPTKVVNSLLTLQRDSQGKVTSHTEEWDHKPEQTSQDGFFGMISEMRKKATAAATAAFVGQEPPRKD